MKLTNLANTRAKIAVKALRENYNIDLRLDKLNRKNTQNMLRKVREVMAESKFKTGQSASIGTPQHMKLVFMEQALIGHLSYLNSQVPRIVVENEEVDKSQVYLAAQEMANSLQDMVEEISDMLNKELPALIQSSQGKVDGNLRQAFKKEATEILSGMLNGIREGTDKMNTAVNTLTGDEAPAEMGGQQAAPEMPAPDQMGGGQQPPMPPEAPEPPAVPGAGRTRR